VTDFADFDPEDAWDGGDDDDTKLAVLERVVAALRASSDRREPRRRDALRLVATLPASTRLDVIRADLEAL
jgi:hypothetical protein